MQAAGGHQGAVHGGEPACIDGPGRGAEHGGLAVHAAAGAHDGVGAGHEPAAVERFAAPEESAEAGGLQVGGLGRHARQKNDRDRRCLLYTSDAADD